MATYLEHNNVTVSDLDYAIKFFLTIFPDWKIRHRGYLDEKAKDTDWAHIGTDSSYLALQAPAWDQPFVRQPSPYFDHMAFVVDDLDSVTDTIKNYPFRVRSTPETEGFKRVYVYIFDGIILELIEYKTDDVAIRNNYCH